MIKKICLLSCQSMYDSKPYFTQKFAQALNRKGVETLILSWTNSALPDEFVSQIQEYEPDLSCSFHSLPPQSNGQNFWDTLKLPHWTILVDPAFYDFEMMTSPYSIISCVDRSDCDLLRSYHFNQVFFFPLAIEKELITPLVNLESRAIDVVMPGTCYDYDYARAYWQKKYSRKVSQVLDDAIERVLSDNKTSCFSALLLAMTSQGLDSHEVNFEQLAYYVHYYTRGIERVQLIRSIKDVEVHVYGAGSLREGRLIKDWSYYLSKQSNVTIHPPVNYNEVSTILKNSKICLNSMPFFKNGVHDRVFAALACGALPVTTDNLWMRENFSDDKELFLFQFTELDQVNDRIKAILKDTSRLQKVVGKGQEKVRLLHTWDNRAESALKELLPMVEKINRFKFIE